MNKWVAIVLLFIVCTNAFALTATAPVVLDPTSSTIVTQGTGSNLHVQVDSAPTTAVTGTFWQATQPVSGTFWQATQPISATQLPASLGQTTMAASTSVTIASNQSAVPVSFSAGTILTRVDTFTTTSNGTTLDAHLAPVKSFAIGVVATGAVTSWTVVLECSLDNSNFTAILTHTNTTPGTGQTVFSGTSLLPCLYFRSRTSAITLGAGTNLVVTILGM